MMGFAPLNPSYESGFNTHAHANDSHPARR
jgi:hypothetical protein